MTDVVDKQVVPAIPKHKPFPLFKTQKAPQTPTADAFDAGADRRRFRNLDDTPDAVLVLDARAIIQGLTPTARRLLDYQAEQAVASSFFTHVHDKDLYRVMRDVAEMVCHGRQKASWLLRLRTGRGRWRWFKTSVRNALNDADATIVVRLRDVLE